jgi:hypothetical protein
MTGRAGGGYVARVPAEAEYAGITSDIVAWFVAPRGTTQS